MHQNAQSQCPLDSRGLELEYGSLVIEICEILKNLLILP